MEERKQRSEDERARQKQQRKKEQNKRRSLQGLQNDALRRTRDFEKKVYNLVIVLKKLFISHSCMYNSHHHYHTHTHTHKQELQEAAAMDDIGRRSGGGVVEKSLKAYYREFRKVVETSDVVLEVLDARDPLGCRCYQVEQAVMAAGTDKKLILVLNKIGELRER